MSLIEANIIIRDILSEYKSELRVHTEDEHLSVLETSLKKSTHREIKNLYQKIEELEREVAHLEDEDKEKRMKIEDLEEDAETMRDKIEELEEELETYQENG
jgi:chromosome segregation ATPase